MLEKADLKKTMIGPEFKQLCGRLKGELAVLQHAVKEKRLPVIVLFEGWSAAGKGSMLADLILTLDPRSFKVYSTLPPTEEERRRPFLYRHWIRTPEGGRFSIFDRSWYPEVSLARVEEKLRAKEAYRMMDSINTFERQLSDDGTLIIKFFLHISHKEQEKRLKKLSADKDTAWRVTPRDWKRYKLYDEYYTAFDEMLEHTDTPYAPWHVIASHDKGAAMAEIYRVMVTSIKSALAAKEKPPLLPEGSPEAGGFPLVRTPKLSDIPLDMTVDPERYKELLKKKQKKLAELHNRLYRTRTPVVVVYEGWDAAGKGGNIRRLVKSLDPRGYEVVPIAAPSKTELAHQYLWRFWKEVPKDGHVAIFDRSWYGRVMVEHIEGFCTPQDYHRAFREINEFEKELYDWGAVVIKFWLQIDKEEQLRRFKDRQETPEKQWKITDEDWRNREKWDQYEDAVNRMLELTSTEYAPWTIIESQDKRFARLKAIEAFISAIQKRL